MRPITFVHAADLHLDAASGGLGADMPPAFAERLHSATFVALDRLVALCLAEQADFLVLAGDVYNHEDGSLRAQIALRDACARLDAAGIPVFIAHGNHDPLSSRIASLVMPSGTLVFGEDVSVHPVVRDGETIALVHGISHASTRETRNLARRFARTADACPQVGVLHCTIGTADGEQRYAPCTVEDLASTGLDYWALGHIHLRQVLCETPRVVYPGSTQGLHIGEEGDHGCTLVRVDAAGGIVLEERPLGPIRWQAVRVDIGPQPAMRTMESKGRPPTDTPRQATAATSAYDAPLADVDGLVARTVRAIEEAAAEAHAGCTGMVIRLVFEGRGPLDRLLRRPTDASDLLDLLRGEVADLTPPCWVKDMEVHTRPDVDMDAMLRRDDLLGATLRNVTEALQSPDGMSGARTALAALYEHHAARKALPPLDEATLAALIADAGTLCLDLLESD